MSPLFVVAQAQGGAEGIAWLDYGALGVLSLVIAWLLKVGSSDRKESREAHKEIAAGNQASMKDVAVAIKTSGDTMAAAIDNISQVIRTSDTRSIKSAIVMHAAVELLGPPGAGRPTQRAIVEAVENARRKLE